MDTHAERNASALDEMKRFLPPNIWTTSYQVFKEVAAHVMPEKLVQHLWANKVLWWTRLDPTLIAKIHIADLRSKYLIVNLDVTEMRAVMACLPDAFENDPNGEKAVWRANTLESIRGYLKQEAAKQLPKSRLRNQLYFNVSTAAFSNSPRRGPMPQKRCIAVFSPLPPPHSLSMQPNHRAGPSRAPSTPLLCPRRPR